MKQLIFTSIILSLFFVFNNLQAQIPQTMSYQGILQTNDGNLVSDDEYLNGILFFNTHQDAGNKIHEIPRLSLGISSAK